jgi:hypothetical protein
VVNQPESVAALVELGCDTATRVKTGSTGQQLAEQRGHAAVLDVLRGGTAAALLKAGHTGDLCPGPPRAFKQPQRFAE